MNVICDMNAQQQIQFAWDAESNVFAAKTAQKVWVNSNLENN